MFGTVLTILGRGTPNFRRVNVSVPNVIWHQCSKFQGCRDYLSEVVSARVNEARRKNLACRVDFFSARKWGFMLANQQHCKCIRLFSTFLCRRCTTSNCPILRFWRTNSLFKRPFSHHRRRRCLISLMCLVFRHLFSC